MRAVMNALRMQRQHGRTNIIAAEEIAVMIEEHFIVIGIAMIERDLQRIRIFFERTRQEAFVRGQFPTIDVENMRASGHMNTRQ